MKYMNYYQKQKAEQQRLDQALAEDTINFNRATIQKDGVVVAQGEAEILNWLKSQPKAKDAVKMVRIPKPINTYRRKNPCTLKAPTITPTDRAEYIKGIAQGKYGTSTRLTAVVDEYVTKQAQQLLNKHQRKYGYKPPMMMIKDYVKQQIEQN